jgi:hypothetical protein
MTTLALLVLSAQIATAPEIKVDGEGYLRFTREGRTVFSRTAKLSVKEGRVANEQGCFVLPTVLSAHDATIEADADGNLYSVAGGTKTRIGRLVLAVFPADAMLTESSGMMVAIERPVLKFPGENGASKLTLVTEPQKQVFVPKPQPQNPKPQTPKPDPKPENPKPQNPEPQNPKPPVTNQLVIDVLPTAEVNEENVTLADIAKIAGPKAEEAGKVVLGQTPMLGIKRTFEKPLIQGRLRAAGFKNESYTLNLNQPVEVTRKGQNIANTQFVKAVLDAVKGTSGVAVQYDSKETQPDYIAPVGRINLVVETLSGINSPTVTSVVGIYVEGKRINSRTVRLQAVSNPQAVKSGQPVKVLMRAGGAVVEVSGVSRGTGPVGAEVAVEVRIDANTRSTHTGKIVAEGKVEVTL